MVKQCGHATVAAKLSCQLSIYGTAHIALCNNSIALWSQLVCLACAGCQNVRNRNLAILSRSGLKISSLVIGHTALISYGKPRITNQVRPSRLVLLSAESAPFCMGSVRYYLGAICLHLASACGLHLGQHCTGPSTAHAPALYMPKTFSPITCSWAQWRRVQV